MSSDPAQPVTPPAVRVEVEELPFGNSPVHSIGTTRLLGQSRWFADKTADELRVIDRRATIAIVSFYLAVTFLTFNTIEEDAFIYFRIIENILGGHGYVFNRGEAPLEVGSSISWVGLLILFGAISPLPLVLTAKLLGITCGIGMLALMVRWGTNVIGARPAAYLPSLLTACSTPVLMYNQRGLETPLYTLVVVALAYTCTSDRLHRYWAIPTALAILTRSEGFLLVGALVPFFIVRRLPLKNLALGLSGLGALLVAIEVWRYQYFGELLPSPFYAKAARPLTFVMLDLYLNSGPRKVLAVILALLVFTRGFWTRDNITIAGLLIVLGYFASSNVELKPFSRHFSAFTPLFYTLLLSSMRGYADRLHYLAGLLLAILTLSGSEYRVTGKKMQSPITSTLLAATRSPMAFIRGTLSKMATPFQETSVDRLTPDWMGPLGTNYQSRVGDFVRMNYPAGTRLVYDQMGQTPYRAGADRHFLDSFGLCNGPLSHRKFFDRAQSSKVLQYYDRIASTVLGGRVGDDTPILSDDDALDYIFASKPDVIMVNRFMLVMARNKDEFYPRLVKDPRLKTEYENRYMVDGRALVFERKGLTQGVPVVPPGVPVTKLEPKYLEPSVRKRRRRRKK